MIRSTFRWILSHERRWPIPLRALLIFRLVFGPLAGWLIWRTVEDNRMYRRFLTGVDRQQFGWDRVFLNHEWLPAPVQDWLAERDLFLFGRLEFLDSVETQDEVDRDLLHWVTTRGQVKSVTLNGQFCGEYLDVVCSSPHVREITLQLYSSDDTLAHLEENESLESSSNEHHVVDLRPLARCAKLQTLHVWDFVVDRSGFEVIEQLQSLQKLTLLLSTPVPIDHIQKLKKLPNLTSLTILDSEKHLEARGLGFSRQLDVAFDDIDRLQLDKLQVWADLSPKFTIYDLRVFHDSDIKSLAALPVAGLVLYGGSVTDAGLASFEGLPRLEDVSLFHTTSITDASCSVLASLPRMRSLRLVRVPVTDAGLKALEQAPRLEWLFLEETAVSPNALKEFERRLPGVLRSRSKCALSDE